MQIERVNDMQFRCILGEQDLDAWNLDFSNPDSVMSRMDDIACACLEQAREEIGFVADGRFALKLDVAYFPSGTAVLIFTKISDLLGVGDEKLFEDEKQFLEDVSSAKVFLLRSLNIVLSAASRLNGIYSGLNTLYKDERTGDYYLVLNKSEGSDEGFNQICNIIGEFGEPVHGKRSSYFNEHYDVIVAKNALQTLATI